MILGLAIAALVATAPTLARPADPPTQVAVVYDATTGAIDEIIIPDHEGELDGPLQPLLAIPNGIVVRLPIDKVRAGGFAATLAGVAPTVPALQAQAAEAAVSAALAASQKATP